MIDDDRMGSVVIGSEGLYGTEGYIGVGATQVSLTSFVSWVNAEVAAGLDGVAGAPSLMIGSKGITIESSDESSFCKLVELDRYSSWTTIGMSVGATDVGSCSGCAIDASVSSPRLKSSEIDVGSCIVCNSNGLG